MKNILENKEKIWEKYKYYIILCLIIVILFLLAGYSRKNVEYTMYLNNEQITLKNGIYTLDDEQYIHIQDLTSLFKDNIFEDKISGKIVITTYDSLKRIKKNDKDYAVKNEGQVYFNLKKILEELDKESIISKNNIYIIPKENIDGIIKKNRVEVYSRETKTVIGMLNKNENIKILVDNNLKDNNCKMLSVTDEQNYYGYILKDNVEYEYINNVQEIKVKKEIIVKVDKEVEESTDTKYVDALCINMYRLSDEDSITKLDYTNNMDNSKVFAVITNGYKSSNYDQDIVTAMLNSDTNRQKVINSILNGVKKYSGANIDFANMKVVDKEKFTQFIKELAAILHSNNKRLILNIPSTQYIDVNEVSKVVDYVVIQPYFARTLASKTSGPISAIPYVKDTIQQIINSGVEVNKVILEVPAYTILWTERGGTVINAEQYSVKVMKEYVQSNNLKSHKDKSSGQNVISYTKGIITYKMWLEDEMSIIEKGYFVSGFNINNYYNGNTSGYSCCKCYRNVCRYGTYKVKNRYCSIRKFNEYV